MLMNAAKISEIIRAKKKKLLEQDPEVGTSEPAEMNAQVVEELKQKGRIEATLNSPAKINADDTNMDESPADANDVGVTPEQKTRMGRLRGFFAKLNI